MGAEAWVLWQPDWNVIAFDAKGGVPLPKKQFYALAQYTRFIRPGFRIISAGGAYNTLAAYSSSAKQLVLVSTNWDAVTPTDLDLSAFTAIASSATAYRTTADTGTNLREVSIKLSSGHIIDELPARSVTTYVIGGVSPLAIPGSRSVEGMHQIVSAGTKLCLNINRNSTRSGEGIIPYPCSGFSNMEFNFVDQRNGSYSIHTVNVAKGLCLNLSNATASPGDGKRYGGPGNLIQWNCDGPLPDNELFEIVELGGDRVQIRVKSSGLCLEDPGRGGTIRQNRCNRSLMNQVYMLTDEIDSSTSTVSAVR
jgi:hypothetical protein